MRAATPFTISSKNVKYLELILTNQVKIHTIKTSSTRRKKLKKISEVRNISLAYALVDSYSRNSHASKSKLHN